MISETNQRDSSSSTWRLRRKPIRRLLNWATKQAEASIQQKASKFDQDKYKYQEIQFKICSPLKYCMFFFFFTRIIHNYTTITLHSHFLTSVYATFGCKYIQAALAQERTNSGRRKKWPLRSPCGARGGRCEPASPAACHMTGPRTLASLLCGVSAIPQHGRLACLWCRGTQLPL